MKRFTLSCSFVCLLVFGIHPVAAQDNEPVRLAEEIITLTNVAARTQKLLDNLKQVQIAQIERLNLPPEAHQLATVYQEKVLELMTQEMNWAKVKDEYIQIYADTFSAEELRGIADFYKSPAGQALLKKNPALLAGSMQATQRHFQNIAPKIQELQREMIEEAKALQKKK